MRQTAKKFDGLALRVRTALLLAPVVLLPIYWGGFAFVALLMVAAILMAYEWVTLLHSRHKSRDEFLLSALLVGHIAVGAFTTPQNALLLLLVSLCFCAGVAYALRARLTPIIGGLLYIGWPLLTALYLHVVGGALGAVIVFYVLMSVWAVDIFAMFSGKIIGGPKLAPRLSPNKTWAGLLGAMVGASVVGFAFFFIVENYGLLAANAPPDASPNAAADLHKILALALCIALVAQLADLFESYIKRKYNRKESGNLIPGHGGILDRVDGLIGVLIFLHLLVLFDGFLFGAPLADNNPIAATLWLVRS